LEGSIITDYCSFMLFCLIQFVPDSQHYVENYNNLEVVYIIEARNYSFSKKIAEIGL
jgi:hypothetical protein